MNDELPELSPAETERVRRLLAEARHTDPVPADVAARLDRTLETLAQERQSHQVVTLASRRRRRATQLLVAAVAVVAVGIGVGQLVSGLDGDPGVTASDSAADGPAEAAAPDQQDFATEPPSAESDGDNSAGGETANDRKQAKSFLALLPRVDDATFDDDAAATRPGDTGATPAPDGAGPGAAFAGTCDRDAWGDGERVLVRYRGEPAALVFRPAAGGSQVVDLFACDGDDVLRSGIVAAP